MRVSVGLLLALLMSVPARAETFELAPDQTAVGSLSTYATKPNDTLLDVARNFDLGYTELITANRGTDPWLPGADRQVVIPNFFLLPDVAHEGIVINLVRQRLFYFPPDGQTVETYPIGVGVQGWETPLGTTTIVSKKEHPTWYPPASIRATEPGLPDAFPPGPDNPMGDYALYLGWPTYAIHGTDKPFGVGRNVSHGCIRMYPEDIDRLFHEVSIGTKVTVISQEAQVAWIGDDLYLAVFPDKIQTDELDVAHPLPPADSEGVSEAVMLAAEGKFGRVDWDLVDEVARDRTGIPIQVTREDETNQSDAP